MQKKHTDLSALGAKIAHRNKSANVYKKFESADEILGVEKKKIRQRIVRKSYALMQDDIENIEAIKDKCLNKKVVLSDSHVVRLSIKLAASLSEKELIQLSEQIPKLAAGRPKKD